MIGVRFFTRDKYSVFLYSCNGLVGLRTAHGVKTELEGGCPPDIIKPMLIVGFLSWWYSAGWVQRFEMISQRFASTLDYFSPGLLVSTWFAPFRQISAGRVQGSLGMKWRAFVDRLISRVIGGLIRTVLLIAAGVMLVIHSAVAVIELLLWALLPLIPLVGFVLMISGWVPSWR